MEGPNSESVEETLQLSSEDKQEASQETVESLIEKGVITEEDIAEYENRANLMQVETTEPDKVGITDILATWFNNAKHNIKYSITSVFADPILNPEKRDTWYGEISQVSYTDDGQVQLLITHKRGSRTITLDSQGKKLANIESYHSCDNPAELKGKKLIREPKILKSNFRVPHNTSIVGKIRYKIAGSLFHIKSKQYEEINDEKLVGIGLATMICIWLMYSTVQGAISGSFSYGLLLPFGTLMTVLLAIQFINTLFKKSVMWIYPIVEREFETI